jgi:tRNA nucleotidyltransferase (CCA-adding enzyme)
VSEDIEDVLALQKLETHLDQPGLKPAELFDLLHGRSHAALLASELVFDRPNARASVALYLSHLRHVRPALAGRDLLQLGFTDGPELGRALAALRSARLNGEVASRQDETALALRLLRDRGR